MPDQADADPVSVLLAWFRDHDEALDLLGGPEHFSGVIEGPWPHVVIGDGPGGSLRELRWVAEPEVAVDVYSAPNGAPGWEQMRKILVRLLRIAAELPETQIVTAATPVVCNVRPAGSYSSQLLTNGQIRYGAGLLVAIRPPSL